MGDVFYWVFNMSIIASCLGGIVLVLRKIKAIPRRAVLFLWIVPFVRFCVPIGVDSPFSLMGVVSRVTTRRVIVFQSDSCLDVSLTNAVMVAEDYFPNTYKIKLLSSLFDIASLIWVFGAGIIILFLITVYVKTTRAVSRADAGKDGVLVSDIAETPAVYGIIRPIIVIPPAYADKDIKQVVSHEKMHIQRRDNLWRILGLVVVAVHWFNPVAWLLLKVFLSDLEFACDEAIVSKMTPEERRKYARKLLDCISEDISLVSESGGAGIKSRIKVIMSYKNLTRFSAVCFGIMIFAIMVILLTNAG